MKSFLIIIFCIYTIQSYSQPKPPTAALHRAETPAIFLDSIQINSLGSFDNDKIESVNIVKSNAAFPNGRIYIKSKTPGSFKFLTAKEILKVYKISDITTPIFMLDNEIIADTSDFSIDSSYILEVKVIKASEIAYLPNNFSSLATLKIFTNSGENLDKQQIVRIRRSGAAILN